MNDKYHGEDHDCGVIIAGARNLSYTNA